MDSILTSCRGRGTVMARLKESWQRWVLLKAHWTRTRCKAGDSRERDVGGCGSREILGVTRRQPLTVFLDAELTDPPRVWSVGSWRILAANGSVPSARSPRLPFPLLKRPVFPAAPNIRYPLCASGPRATVVVPPPHGEGGLEEPTDGHFECPPWSWNPRRTRPGRRAAAQRRRTRARRRPHGRRGGILH